MRVAEPELSGPTIVGSEARAGKVRKSAAYGGIQAWPPSAAVRPAICALAASAIRDFSGFVWVLGGSGDRPGVTTGLRPCAGSVEFGLLKTFVVKRKSMPHRSTMCRRRRLLRSCTAPPAEAHAFVSCGRCRLSRFALNAFDVFGLRLSRSRGPLLSWVCGVVSYIGQLLLIPRPARPSVDHLGCRRPKSR